MLGIALTNTWAKNSSGPVGDDALSGIHASCMRQHLLSSLFQKFAEKYSSIYRPANAGYHHHQDRGHPKRKRKRHRVSFCKFRGRFWVENAYIITQCLILYPNISGRTRRIRNKVRSVHSVSHDNTREDLVNTSTESVTSRNRTDRGGANFFICLGIRWGRWMVYNWHERGVL